MIGKEKHIKYWSSNATMPDAITIKDLSKSYPTGTQALKGITLSIKSGEFFALLGPNGAGKTTTINILAGLANKSSGEVSLFDKDVYADYKEARSYLGLVPQEFNLDIWETVYNTLSYNAGYFGIPKSERPAKIEKILRQMDLWEKRQSRIRELSGGMKRKVMIGRALIHEPKILILDEPTAGVDVETRKLMWDFFRELNRQGTTILLTTHYIEEAEELCQRIAIINQGTIIAMDSKDKMLHLLERETVVIKMLKPLASIPPTLKKFKPLINNNVLQLEFNPAKETLTEVMAAVHKAKIIITKLESRRTTLEDVFLHLTKRT